MKSNAELLDELGARARSRTEETIGVDLVDLMQLNSLIDYQLNYLFAESTPMGYVRVKGSLLHNAVQIAREVITHRVKKELLK